MARQVLWPDHCVQGTGGAAFRQGSRRSRMPSWCCARVITARSTPIRRSTKTIARRRPGLPAICASAASRRVFLAGLAFDFCVRYSAEDAYREGFAAIVIEDGCRGIDVSGSMAATREQFRTMGIRCVSASAIEGGPNDV